MNADFLINDRMILEMVSGAANLICMLLAQCGTVSPLNSSISLSTHLTSFWKAMNTLCVEGSAKASPISGGKSSKAARSYADVVRKRR